MTSHYTYAVIGGGIEGSATAYYLAKHGFKTVLLEQFRPGHTRGGSHGHSRITRKAYAETVCVEMMQRAFPLWDELEREAGEKFYKHTGVVRIGSIGSDHIDSIVNGMSTQNVPVVTLTVDQLHKRYPQLKFDSDWQILYDESGGTLKADRCLNAFQTQFVNYGGDFHYGNAVTSIEPGKIIKVNTVSGRRYTCDGLAICLGTWTGEFLKKHLGLNLPLQPLVVKSCYWKVEKKGLYSVQNGFPCIIFLHEKNHERIDEIYCLPSDEYTDLVKVCSHEGVPINHPDERDSVDTSLYIKKVQNFITKHMKHVEAKPAIVETCLYMTTPDDNYILDTHPQFDNIAIGVLAGHGFKMAPVVGEILASLLLKRPTFDLSMFSIRRFLRRPLVNKL